MPFERISGNLCLLGRIKSCCHTASCAVSSTGGQVLLLSGQCDAPVCKRDNINLVLNTCKIVKILAVCDARTRR